MSVARRASRCRYAVGFGCKGSQTLRVPIRNGQLLTPRNLSEGMLVVACYTKYVEQRSVTRNKERHEKETYNVIIELLVVADSAISVNGRVDYINLPYSI